MSYHEGPPFAKRIGETKWCHRLARQEMWQACPWGSTERDIHETKEISENIYMDIDEKGNLVSMTIEHAKASAGLWEFSYQEMSRHAAEPQEA
jgi:uncharacterized protein YuzE